MPPLGKDSKLENAAALDHARTRVAATHSSQQQEHAEAGPSRRQPPPPQAPALPSLQELCIRSLCETNLEYCHSLELVPDHLAVDMMLRIINKGKLSPELCKKFQSSTCDEVQTFANECLDRYHQAQISAGPVTPKSYGCRF
mmetsp:Transcript_37050/g.57932  ORF Transcript_37050/g.57932 Transcript_37050/m.57932 type:complete len:142 (-) Transcript_37050:564-989(-)